MKIKSLLFLASLIIAITLGVVGYILVPVVLWSTAALVSFVFLIGTMALMLHPTFGLPEEKHDTDAAVFAAIGPVAVYFAGLIVWNAAAFLVSLKGMDKVGYAMMAVGVASFFLLIIYVKVGASIVNASAVSMRADRARLDYLGLLTGFTASVESNDARNMLQKLVDDIGFAPASHADWVAEHDARISELVQQLMAQGRSINQAQVEPLASEIRNVLAVRATRLKMNRTKR